MSYINDPREMTIRPESGVTLEQDNRIETMYHWGAMVTDLCDLPVSEYMKPMTVIALDGGALPDTGETLYKLQFVIDEVVVYEDGLPSGGAINFDAVNAVKEGRNFLGWYYGNIKYEQGALMPSKNLRLTAKYECDVKFIFIVDGVETEVSAYTINYNSTLNNIPDTEMSGYEFKGWEPSIDNPVTAHTVYYGTFEVIAPIYYGAYVTSATSANDIVFNENDMGPYFKTAKVSDLLTDEGISAPIYVPADEYLCSEKGQNLSDEEWDEYCNARILAHCWLLPIDVANEYTFTAFVTNEGYSQDLTLYNRNLVINNTEYSLYIFLNPDLKVGDSDSEWEYNLYLKNK